MWSVATLKATRGEGNEGSTFITHETMSNGVVQDSNRTASVRAPRAPGRRDAVESAFTSPPRVPRRRPPWLSSSPPPTFRNSSNLPIVPSRDLPQISHSS